MYWYKRIIDEKSRHNMTWKLSLTLNYENNKDEINFYHVCVKILIVRIFKTLSMLISTPILCVHWSLMEFTFSLPGNCQCEN